MGSVPGSHLRVALAVEEGPHEGRRGLMEDLVRRADLVADAVFKHGDPLGEGEGLFLVVRHVNGRDAQALLEFGELLARAEAQLRVEVAQGFVEEEDARMNGQRARAPRAVVVLR